MVEWKKLGEVCVIKNGYTPSTKENSYWENGTLPWFTLEDIRKNGRILEDAIKHITSLGVKKGGLFPKDSIIVSTTATIGEYALIKSDFLCNQQITCLTIKTDLKEQLLPKYLYYLSDRIGKWCKKNVNGGGSLLIVSTSKLNNFLIPIPSIEEQNRIVGILDTFTVSIDNLKEQIAQRRKQYEYYRDQLLDLEGKEGVEMKYVSNFVKDRIFANELTKQNYTSVENLLKDKAGRKDAEKIPVDGNWIRYKKGDILIGNIRPYLRKIWLSDREGGTNGDVIVIRPNKDYMPEYLYYCLSSERFFLYYNQSLKDGKMPRGDKSRVLTYIILTINKEKQQRIVDILDQFETSIRNLEAQLSQREKQYEYYRNKLLTFED